MIAIPNMDKPKSCYECPIARSYVDCLMEKKYVCPIGHTDDCPLIEISETKYHNMVVALDILEHEQNDCIEAERRADEHTIQGT